MKIALCLTGQPRCYEQGFSYISKNLLYQYDVDVFFHTWNNPNVDYGKIINLYNPKDYTIDEPFNREFANKYTRVSNIKFPAYNTLSSFFSVFSSIFLKRKYEMGNGFQYDAVVRCRFDMALNFTPDFASMENEILHVPDDLFAIGNELISDHFAYGNSNIMDKYSTTFINADALYDQGTVMNSEEMCTANIHLNNLKLKRINLNNPFPPDSYGSLPHSFIRADMNKW